MIQDLQLTRRQPVFFVKDSDGRWVLRNKQEVVELIDQEKRAYEDRD